MWLLLSIRNALDDDDKDDGSDITTDDSFALLDRLAIGEILLLIFLILLLKSLSEDGLFSFMLSYVVLCWQEGGFVA